MWPPWTTSAPQKPPPTRTKSTHEPRKPSIANGTAPAKFTLVKHTPKPCKYGAFTLIELLAVTAIIGVLAALLLTAIAKAPHRARLLACSSNLRQMGLAFHVFAHEHGGRFPQSVPLAEGGALEWNRSSPGYASVYVINPQVFRAMSNELGSVRILVCPSAPQRRAADFSRLGYTNLSYATGVAASLEAPTSALGLDNNLVPTSSRTTQVVPELPGFVWGPERHESRGNILSADGSVSMSLSKATQIRSIAAAAPMHPSASQR